MSKSRRVWPVVVALPAALLLLGSVLIGGAQSGFSAGLTQSVNKIGTGTAFLTAKQGATQLCSSQPVGSVINNMGTFECTGSLLPNVVISTSDSKVTTLTNPGSQKFGSASVKVNACSPQILVNSKVANNAFVSRGDLGWSAAGVSKLAGSGSMGFNGSTTLGSQFSASTAPQTYSVAAWFKTSTSAGGIFGYSNSLVGSSAGSHDRELYFDASGNLTFYTYASGAQKKVATSGINYADDNWHLAVAVATGGTGAKIELYVDNAYIGATTTGTTNSSEATNGYWRVGQNFGSTLGGNGNYFTGNISNMATFSSALTAANVATLWNQSTQSGYSAAVNALPAVNVWALNDAGTATVSNSTTIAMGSYDPCQHVNITIASSTECVFPAGASCPAIGSSSSIASLVSGGAKTFTSPDGGGSTTLTVNTARNSSYQSGVDENIDLLLDETISTTAFSQTFHWSK